MRKNLGVIRVNKNSFEGVLGALEHDIMDALWTRGVSSGREVFDILKTKRDIALTTVLTVIERLTKKTLIEKIKGDATYIYAPVYSKEEFTRLVSADMLKRIMRFSTPLAVASFVDVVADTDPKELDRLSELIKAKKKEISRNA